jgi:hypothetical protein
LGGGIDGREKASTMYCSDSAFAIYEFNNQEEIKRRWTIFLQLGGQFPSLKNISGK